MNLIQEEEGNLASGNGSKKTRSLLLDWPIGFPQINKCKMKSTKSDLEYVRFFEDFHRFDFV